MCCLLKGSSNLVALSSAATNGNAGKLSDTWIRANCDRQYLQQQYDSSGTPNTYFPNYCKMDAISSYADGSVTPKKCSGSTEMYKADGSYDKNTNSASNTWAIGFSTWMDNGDMITQLNYGLTDPRWGSHVQLGGVSSGGCGSGGGCHTMIWCAS